MLWMRNMPALSELGMAGKSSLLSSMRANLTKNQVMEAAMKFNNRTYMYPLPCRPMYCSRETCEGCRHEATLKQYNLRMEDNEMKDTNYSTYYQSQSEDNNPEIPVVEMSDIYDLETGMSFISTDEPTDAEILAATKGID